MPSFQGQFHTAHAVCGFMLTAPGEHWQRWIRECDLERGTIAESSGQIGVTWVHLHVAVPANVPTRDQARKFFGSASTDANKPKHP